MHRYLHPMASRDDTQRMGRDWGVACGLALMLALAWGLHDWANLSRLHLPDTDDVVRLQQIRDWIAGQDFADMSQHRIGGGLPMHWSRIADLVPAGVIMLLTPLAGKHLAELIAVIAWPTALFAAALFLVGRIAHRLAPGMSATAMMVAALAYPATTLFVPGRIDHHGLQVVMMLAIVAMLVGSATRRAGFIAGVAGVASIVIGLETAPLIALAALMLVGRWVVLGSAAERRLLGFGIAASTGLLVARAVFRTWQWEFPGCDGFDAVTWRAAQIAAAAPIVIALAGYRLNGVMPRAVASAAVGAATLVVVLVVSPQCLSPYGSVTPMLTQFWLARVGEAQPLFAAPVSVAIGYAGVLIAGIVATAAHVRRDRGFGWTVLLVVQLGALALACIQLRGAYAGAMLAAPGLALAIVRARERGIGWLAGAWLVSAGTLYPIAADALIPASAGPAPGKAWGRCLPPDALAALARLAPGQIIAPVDLGPYILAATPHSVVAAPYHRNTAGNAAMYRFFLSPPGVSRRIADHWRADYVVLCGTSFGELAPEEVPAATLLNQVRTGRYPAWLTRIGDDGNTRLFRVGHGDPRLNRRARGLYPASFRR